MDNSRIQSLHEAIAVLQEVVAFLKRSEASLLAAESGKGADTKKLHRKRSTIPVDIKQLADSIRSLDREQLIETLSEHSATTLRSLCYQLGLRGMSKRPKNELIDAIARELVDFGQEHRRISTFSQRQLRESNSNNQSNS